MYRLLIWTFLQFLDIQIDVIQNCNVIHPLITCNHVSELDPVVLFYILNNEKIRYIARGDDINKVPIFKAICDYFDVIFIEPKLTLSREIKPGDSVCIFPEGTLFYKSSRERSDAYCDRISIPRFTNVLAPHETGFTMLQGILGKNNTKYTDITLIYDTDMSDSPEPLTIAELIKKRPQRIKVIISESDRPITETYRSKDALIGAYRNLQTANVIAETR